MTDDAINNADGQEANAGSETRIDVAWRNASAEGDDAAAARFIDIVLAEALICPVWDALDEDAADPDLTEDAVARETIAPKLVDIDGEETLLLFDNEERLAMSVEEPTHFVALPGRAFFEMMAGQNIQIALNLDVAPSSTIFVASSVDAVAALIGASEEETEIAAGAAYAVIPPENVSEPMLTAVAARLNSARDVVSEAWLFGLRADEDKSLDDIEARPVLAISPLSDRQTAAHDLGRDLGRVAIAADPDSVGVDVAVLEEHDEILLQAREVGFGLLGPDS